MKAIFRDIQRYPWKAEFRYATGHTFLARAAMCAGGVRASTYVYL